MRYYQEKLSFDDDFTIDCLSSRKEQLTSFIRVFGWSVLDVDGKLKVMFEEALHVLQSPFDTKRMAVD